MQLTNSFLFNQQLPFALVILRSQCLETPWFSVRGFILDQGLYSVVSSPLDIVAAGLRLKKILILSVEVMTALE